MRYKDVVLIFVGGMFARASAWNMFHDFFTKLGYQCVAIPLKYHEDTAPFIHEAAPEGLAQTGLPEYTRDLREKLKPFKNRRIVLVGWSMGGLIVRKAAECLLQDGVDIAGMILLAPAPQKGVWIIQKFSVLRSFWSNLFWGFIPRVWDCWRGCGTQTFNEFAYSMANKLLREQQEEFYKNITWESRKAGSQIAHWWWPFWKGNPSAINEVNLNCQTLYISGDQDRIVPQSVVRAQYKRHRKKLILAGLNPDVVEFCLAPGHGHWLVGHEPEAEQVLKKIAEWLCRLR